MDQILAANHGGGQASKPSFLVLFGAAQPKRSAARAGHGKLWVLQHPTMALAEGASHKKSRPKATIITSYFPSGFKPRLLQFKPIYL
nr:hypothetical protein [uncultured Pseudodesulfovibrio sp.]